MAKFRLNGLGTFVVGNFQIRFDLINFFAMFWKKRGHEVRDRDSAFKIYSSVSEKM